MGFLQSREEEEGTSLYCSFTWTTPEGEASEHHTEYIRR